MAGRIRSVASHSRTTLVSGWELARSRSDTADQPTPIAASWTPVDRLGTVASVLRAKETWRSDDGGGGFDADDWWYRLRFPMPPDLGGTESSITVLGFDGLATVADVWLNGNKILSSANMFVAHEVRVDELLKDGNELVLRFHSLDRLLAERRPRPRWRAPMVEHQQLRWFRTTLLGRLPGWSPAAAPVGPWLPIWIETRSRFAIADLDLRTQLDGSTGVVEISSKFQCIGEAEIATAVLQVERDGERRAVPLVHSEPGRYVCRLEIPSVALWWPHTHGEPALYEARLIIDGVEVDLGRIGFRTVELDTRNGDYALSINGERIFCRGACWTPLDGARLYSNGAEHDTAITQLRSAGMNMVRVGGTMVYERDTFFDACDQQGVLVWQDFMFANMDYPEGDAAFETTVLEEAAQLLRRLGGRPSVAMLCGSSESEQQAAMWGATRDRWEQSLFHRLLPERVRALTTGVPYWPSSAHGGAFPHQSNVGTTSYYGVGAYRRPLTDARRAEVRFATECLAFANVPEEDSLAAMQVGHAIKACGPEWKRGTPRDLGAGWDFDDIRDHYFREIFGIEPLDVRYAEHERYLEMSRAVSGEVMAATFREWRRKRSTCNGAVIWFLRDLCPGAGWGIVAADGSPKAPYYYLRRALQPRTIWFSDEGVNGLFVHVTNEWADPLRARIQLKVYRDSTSVVATAERPINVAGRDAIELSAAECFDGFLDLTYAYRFGPPTHDVVVATLVDDVSGTIAEDFYFPLGLRSIGQRDVGITGTRQVLDTGDVELLIETRCLAYAVTVRAEGFDVEDQYFHLAPATQRRILLRRLQARAAPVATVRALNARSTSQI